MWTEHGNVHFRFKRPWDDGTNGLLMTPFQLIARLAAIVPQPRKNLIHYHGIFAPAAAGRAAIVPVRPPPAARPTLLPPHALLPPRAKSPSWIPWATLLHRVFGANAFACTHCETRTVVHAVVQGEWAKAFAPNTRRRRGLARRRDVNDGSGGVPRRFFAAARHRPRRPRRGAAYRAAAGQGPRPRAPTGDPTLRSGRRSGRRTGAASAGPSPRPYDNANSSRPPTASGPLMRKATFTPHRGRAGHPSPPLLHPPIGLPKRNPLVPHQPHRRLRRIDRRVERRGHPRCVKQHPRQRMDKHRGRVPNRV